MGLPLEQTPVGGGVLEVRMDGEGWVWPVGVWVESWGVGSGGGVAGRPPTGRGWQAGSGRSGWAGRRPVAVEGAVGGGTRLPAEVSEAGAGLGGWSFVGPWKDVCRALTPPCSTHRIQPL